MSTSVCTAAVVTAFAEKAHGLCTPAALSLIHISDPAARPTAIIAQSDLLAVGVIRAAEELGLRVPEDLSVAGFDGIAVDGLGGPVLTTSVQPAVEKGRAAGEQVARMLRGEHGETQHLTCRFRAGTTTAPPAR